MPDTPIPTPQRRRSGGRRVGKGSAPDQRITPDAGRLQPLSSKNLEHIHNAGLEILADIGLKDAPPEIVKAVVERGGQVAEDGRLSFPEGLVTRAIADLRKDIRLFGRSADHTLDLSQAKVYPGTGGASPQIVDLTDGSFRNSRLEDIYDAARLIDKLDHVRFFSRPMVANDITIPRDLDINTTFASLAGTSKHVVVSASDPSHVTDIAQICYTLAGSENAFRERPFLSLNINHVVPPLRFDPTACAVLVEAVRLGIPVMINTFGQMGASSPVTMAGCLAQTHAETLAGLVIAWVTSAKATAIYGARPMITDLRTGGMAGGGGEQALLTAAATQLARHIGLVNSTIAGATDSKLADAQSGFEKALAVTMAVQAGANLVTQAAGTQAGLMATSLEAYVIDNDMLGAILRAAMPIEVDATTLALDGIVTAVRGDGHFLGDPQTYARMKSDFTYPAHSDRQAIDKWLGDGGAAINVSAKATAKRILGGHFPRYIPDDIQQHLRARFPIFLSQDRMKTQ